MRYPDTGTREQPVGAGDSGQVSLLSCRTSDPDELTDTLASVAPGARFQALRATGFEAAVDALALSGSGLFCLRASRLQVDGGDSRSFLALTVPLVGTFESRADRRASVYRRGTCYLHSPHRAMDIATHDSRTLAMTIDPERFAAHLRALEGDGDDSWPRFHAEVDLSIGAGASFLRYLHFVWRELQRESPAFRRPQIAREVENTLLAILADACTAGAADLKKVQRLGATCTGLAEEFLAAHLEQPISLAEVAGASGVSVRALSQAFLAKHGVGPMGFWRRRRLEAAREALRSGDRGHLTVTEVALRFCFDHLGRFAGEYRSAFGEAPSETLRR